MIIMAEGDSGVILMSEAPKSHNGSAILDVAAGITSDSDSESVSTQNTRSYLSAAETKRNKRKNFQPRNIAYSETESIGESFTNRDRTSSDSSESDCALDLSNVDIIKSITSGGSSGNGASGSCGDRAVARLDISKDERSGKGAGKMCKDENYENDESDEPMESSPMDLTCSKNTSPFLYHHQVHATTNSGYSDDSDSDGSVGGGGGGKRCVKKTRKEALTEPTSKSSIVPPYSLHSIVGHSGDASEMKEYYQNTVKELLEIYGLNSDTVTDVAQTITSNVPISNFSSGKILESFTPMNDRGTSFLLKSKTSPKSEPSSPPRSPNSLCATNRANVTSHLTFKSKTDQSFSKQIGNRIQSPIFSTTSGMVLPHNMAAILAVASMKEQLKLNNSSCLDVSPSVTITPSRLSPNLNTENSNNSNSGSLTIRKVSSVSPTPASKENRPQSISASLQQSVSNHPVDYSRYVKRYSTAIDCGSSYCKNLNYREHFHCLDCNSRVFIKKEEMIRHFKWHKKRDESLQHGFMRYSPSDDCSDRFPNCTHNRKQTHYHCIQYVAQGSCDKVYISTSDVQMHANYHRKDSAIIQEGFQRLRATEECRTSYCTFFGQRTTHFHCRREHCQYTFKNKADMEKHKTYHIKDEQLAKDGFKKFLKPDPCGFAGCRFSQVCNHIHCVREGCSYVLHSSGQLLSHKRKHERKDTEIAYRKFKLTQQNLGAFNGTEQLFQQSQMNSAALNAYSAMQDNNYSNSSSEGPSSPANSNKFRSNSIQLTGGYFTENFNPMDFSQSEESSDYCYRYISHFSANDLCPPNSKCLMHGTDHYHCKEANCDLSFKTKEVAESHARQHETEERLSEKVYQDYCQEENCTREKHYHCTWDGCYETVLPNDRLDHLRTHEISTSQMNSLDALFRRKRGRPPKNRVIEVWNDNSGLSGSDSPQAIFTSFKLPKPSSGGSFANSSHQSDNELGSPPPPPPPSGRIDSPKYHISQYALDQYKFEAYTDDCPDPLCTFSSTAASHYHCKRPRCYFATTADTEEPLCAHSDDFHENVDIMDGFLCFDSSVHCRRENCRSNKIKRHFHCVRPGCEFSFEHYPMMLEHSKKHQSVENVAKNFKVDADTEIKREPRSPSSNNSGSVNANIISASADIAVSKSTNVVKASGTFYPLCGLTNTRSSSPTCNNDEKPKFESPLQTEALALGASANATSLLNLLPDDWLQTHTQVKYTTEKPCSRPFCKLKRKDHYHCNMCNQAFSELDKLKQHVIKHTASTISPFIKTENNNNNNNNNNITEDSEDVKRSPVISTSLPLGLESPYQAAGFGAAMAAAQQFAMMTSQGISFIPHGMPGLYTSQSGLMFGPAHAFAHPHPLIANGLLDSLPTHPSNLTAESSTNDLTTRRSSSPSHDISPEMKKARIQSSMRILKDEPVPEGYLRFRFNEDCHYTHCGYREHQTHFHCVRPDCGYSFCDKTRFVQHTARHERLDTLMGGDFQQFRANVSCARRECVYTASLGSSQNKASHFHCLKCDFVCTDTNKVVAHRRQHQKLDSINAAGFEKYTPAQACSQPDTCAHSGKQTHYHCLSCQYAVLGLSQMTAHKFRHME